MDLSSILLITALIGGLLLVLGGERARVACERFIGTLANTENGIRSLYTRMADKAAHPATSKALRILLGAFVRVSHRLWMLLALSAVLLMYYGRPLRNLICSSFS